MRSNNRNSDRRIEIIINGEIMIKRIVIKIFRALMVPERVTVNRGVLDTLWYSDKNDNKIWCDITKLECQPVGAEYQHSQFPRELRHTMLKLCPDGSSRDNGSFTSTYPIDLVIAIYSDGGYTWDESVILVANSCDRCMNALAYQYGLSWGYPKGSCSWEKCGTACRHCVENYDATYHTKN